MATLKLMEAELLEIFKKSNHTFLQEEYENIQTGIAERNLCGRFALYLSNNVNKSNFSNYYVDIEYNRNYDRRVKTILDDNLNEVVINCDIIIHSRGRNVAQDNLIAFEMKKSNRPNAEKEADRKRLRALTKESYDEIWSADGKTLPEHVCGYVWGIYIEINSTTEFAIIEYYQRGKLVASETINYKPEGLFQKN